MILNPLNPYAWSVSLVQVDPVSGAKTPLAAGALAAFLAPSKTATSSPDAGLTCTVNYSGAGGLWTISLPASPLIKSLLDTYFAATGRAYLIVQMPGFTWACAEFVYIAEAQTMEIVE